MLSLLVRPTVITLSGFYCTKKRSKGRGFKKYQKSKRDVIDGQLPICFILTTGCQRHFVEVGTIPETTKIGKWRKIDVRDIGNLRKCVSSGRTNISFWVVNFSTPTFSRIIKLMCEPFIKFIAHHKI